MANIIHDCEPGVGEFVIVLNVEFAILYVESLLTAR